MSRARAYVDDELLSNRVFGMLTRLGNVAPRTITTINNVSARALSARTYSDAPHKVFTASRRVVFREMEYAVPAELGMEALSVVRRRIERSGWRIGFPVEVRYAPADDVWLSTAHQRDTVYLAFHVTQRTDHTAYFEAVERILRWYGGRPHWGKLHTLRDGRSRSALPALGRLPAGARPGGPGPDVRQRLPRPGARPLRHPALVARPARRTPVPGSLLK